MAEKRMCKHGKNTTDVRQRKEGGNEVGRKQEKKLT